ncbi:MAG: tRNA (adenosine(37)-N6)-threonylcarbamoyltransferase complex dimerization subunit type 1 TsaB [Reyranella sp.]|nr:tRNA (adenosine(37)-N6)-threonylcarbamoyltransferase complex dimerization subunit type 1 TsaB [Reyranella sp.]
MPSRPDRRQRPDRPPAVTLVLAFDCAVSGLGVAVVRDDTCLAAVREGGRDQAAGLLPAIERTLRMAGVGRRDLALIAVTVGPGSFTGVRVGLAAARGLAVGLGVPLAGLSATSVLIAQAQAPTADRLAVAAIDSRLGDWFCALGDGAQTPFATTPGGLADRLGGRACAVVGHEAGRLAAPLAAAGIDAIAHEALPDPAILARLALAAGVETWRIRNGHEGLPGPLYLRGVSITLPDGGRRTVDG